MKLTTQHTPVPRYGAQGVNLHGGLIEYKLTDDELAHARAGRLDLIPTGEQRGLTARPVDQPKIRVPKESTVKIKNSATHLTKELLERELKTKTQAQVALEQNVSPGTISVYANKYGLSKLRGKPLRKKVRA